MSKISLKSKHLKKGDLIIRTKSLPNNEFFTDCPAQFVKSTPYHTVVKWGDEFEYTKILLHEKWEDGNWVRWK